MVTVHVNLAAELGSGVSSFTFERLICKNRYLRFLFYIPQNHIFLPSKEYL